METSTFLSSYWNNSYGSDSSKDPYSLLLKLNNQKALRDLPVILFLVVLLIVGISGNIVVCVIYSKAKKKSTSNLFILNLAVLDLLSCTFGIPLEVTDLSLPYMFNAPAVCSIGRAMESCTVIASVFTLVFISVDRYKRICNFGESFKILTVKIMCVVALCSGALSSLPFLVVMGKRTLSLGLSGIEGVGCEVSDNMKHTHFTFAYYTFMLILYIVCLVFVIFVYVRISIFLRRTRCMRIRHIKESNSSTMVTQHSHSVELESITVESGHQGSPVNYLQEAVHTLPRETPITSGVKVTRTTTIFVAITIAFIISFLPFLVVIILYSIIKDIEKGMSEQMKVFTEFCARTYFLNNAINPLIYSALNRKFRHDVKRLFSTNCCKR
ncbi:histamine H2 receptor-like [Crassostrea angulata]|uniref:histamine H2 receptor-like n=1 Tax=Magallana angulata TaxID=2784310 RepID=UPI0022B138EB|nr:histamine H2 receptor-like [Crassostrea angulata]